MDEGEHMDINREKALRLSSVAIGLIYAVYGLYGVVCMLIFLIGLWGVLNLAARLDNAL